MCDSAYVVITHLFLHQNEATLKYYKQINLLTLCDSSKVFDGDKPEIHGKIHENT